MSKSRNELVLAALALLLAAAALLSAAVARPLKARRTAREVYHDSPQTAVSFDAQHGRSGLLNLNTADVSELEALEGIGPAKARAIEEYREEHGAFLSVEELREVEGIGEKIFEKIKSLVCV